MDGVRRIRRLRIVLDVDTDLATEYLRRPYPWPGVKDTVDDHFYVHRVKVERPRGATERAA